MFFDLFASKKQTPNTSTNEPTVDQDGDAAEVTQEL